jgi:hypothetical protein
LIEVKAIGIALDDRHVKQAIDYAANEGVEWVILTNAAQWRLYHVIFAQPIEKKLVNEIDLTLIEYKSDDGLEQLGLYTKEGFKRGYHVELKDKQDATSRFLLAALLLHNDSVLGTIRRELRRIVDVAVNDSDISSVLVKQVIKRDAIEGPEADEATRRVKRKENQSRRTRIQEISGPASVQQVTPTTTEVTVNAQAVTTATNPAQAVPQNT